MDLALLALASETAESLQADALYYRQADGIYYGGWTDYPHAVIELFPMKFHPVSGIRQAVLDMANAAVNFKLPMLPQAVRDEALALERRGWITRCARGAKAKQYRSYPNHLIGLGKWSITGRCNYRCRHCFLSAPDARFGELPTAECLRIIREMAEVGIHAVTLTGGEPLVREDFLTLVDELCKHDITVTQIATNGSLVNDRLLDALEDRGVRPWAWHARDFNEWISRCPKNVLLSHAYYGRTFNLDKVERPRWAPPGYYVQLIRRYEGLDKAGYDQIPCATTWVPDYYAKYNIKDNDVNFPLTVQHCRSVISPKRLKGFLMAPWMPTDQKNRDILLHSIDLVAQSMTI